jgi:hypothetical protein
MSLVPESGFVKHLLFNNTWGDAIVNHRCYTDTWFSLVTETIYDYPHTFRTEKIWKPVLMAHPFVVAANRGYLQDLQAAGFQTFHTLIDESYDNIQDPVSRMQAILSEMKRIAILPIEQKKLLWTNLNKIAQHNQKLFFSKEWTNTICQELVDNINSGLEIMSKNRTAKYWSQTEHPILRAIEGYCTEQDVDNFQQWLDTPVTLKKIALK